MPTTEFKGTKIHYEDVGKGSAIVLLHGFLMDHTYWDALCPALTKGHRVIAIDLPGHGQSDCIGYVHSMEEMAEVVAFVLKQLKIRRIGIVGHSMGGYVALALAEQFPDLVKKLVLFQSTTRGDSLQQQADRDRAIELVKSSSKSFVTKSIPMLFRPVNRKKYRDEIARIKAKAAAMNKQGIIAALAGMKIRPSRELLLKFPPYEVHLIGSDKDPRIPLESLQAQSKHSDQCHLHVLKGCGHMALIEDNVNTIELLRRLLKD